jgi:hypothetical protein
MHGPGALFNFHILPSWTLLPADLFAPSTSVFLLILGNFGKWENYSREIAVIMCSGNVLAGDRRNSTLCYNHPASVCSAAAAQATPDA